MAETPIEVTQLLVAWGSGDQAALDALMPLVYDELRRLAHRYMERERRGHTLQTTALVNEVYLKLVNERAMQWQHRAHFFAVAAQLIRNILVDYARTKNYAKRGGDAQRVEMDVSLLISHKRPADVLALDDALQRLAQFDARKSRIVELRFFGGLSIEETAHVLEVSPGTVMRDWTLAKAWLKQELAA